MKLEVTARTPLGTYVTTVGEPDGNELLGGLNTPDRVKVLTMTLDDGRIVLIPGDVVRQSVFEVRKIEENSP